jgi:molybdate transport system ATP-binding protein
MGLVVNIKKRLKGFSIDIAFKTAGEYLGILGASGSGKSLTLKCIAGVETPDEGQIVLNGKTLFDSAKKINLKPQDRNIGYLFQNYALFPHLTVEENIGVGLDITKEEKGQKIAEMIKVFNLNGLEKKHPNQISGGQQQRVALARAIIFKPDILMLDEPFTALDTYLKEQLQNRVSELLKLYAGEVLMVTHSRDEIYRFCKRLVVLDKGRSILSGDTRQIFKQPKLLSVARLTGCKNISKCEILSPQQIYASDWDIILETEEIVSERIKYLGIRAHDFKIIDNSGEKDNKNIINCKINRIVEDLFEYNIFLENKESKKNQRNSEILYKISKEKWDNIKDKETLQIKISKDSILLLE